MFENIINSNTLYLVAGPCAAETFSQLSETCEALMCETLDDAGQADIKGGMQGGDNKGGDHVCRNTAVNLLRCGVWKPRTRPGGFEGVGEEALRWIQQLKRQHPSWLFATEVATPQHAELALQYHIDAVWLGARTTGNPFLVTELVETLKGSTMPVMLKNPISPDVRLWMGAIERFQKAGLTDIAAIHRGFKSLSPSYNELRNAPLWEVPMELRRMMPQVPLLCDPSHLGGSRKMIAPLSQTAVNLDFDGLMIESHIHPSQALTDARQQVTPQELHTILGNLVLPNRSGASKEAPKELTVLREKLNIVDDELLHLVGQRLEISRQIAEVKTQHGMTIYQPQQWDRKLHRILENARRLGLDEHLVETLFRQFHMSSIQAQEVWQKKHGK